MARRSGTDVLRVNVRGAGKAAKDFNRMKRRIQDAINAELRLIGIASEDVFRDVAPEDTGQLGEAIRAVPLFRALRPSVRVLVEPLEGHGGNAHDYLTVTRRGHKKRRIYPRTARALKVHVEGHRNPHAFIFRASVAGVGHEGEGAQPIIDWVSRAQPQITRTLDKAERRLGRRIERGFK